MLNNRAVLSLMCFLTRTSVVSLRIDGNNVWLLVCHFGTHMDVSSWEIV